MKHFLFSFLVLSLCNAIPANAAGKQGSGNLSGGGTTGTTKLCTNPGKIADCDSACDVKADCLSCCNNFDDLKTCQAQCNLKPEKRTVDPIYDLLLGGQP